MGTPTLDQGIPQNLTPVTCDCGSDLFLLANKAFKASSLITKSGRTELNVVPALVCFKCHKELDVNE